MLRRNKKYAVKGVEYTRDPLWMWIFGCVVLQGAGKTKTWRNPNQPTHLGCMVSTSRIQLLLYGLTPLHAGGRKDAARREESIHARTPGRAYSFRVFSIFPSAVQSMNPATHFHEGGFPR